MDPQQQIHQLSRLLSTIQFDYWRLNFLFTWKWWLFLILFIFPWFIWWRLVDKKIFFRVFTYCLLMAIIDLLSDKFFTFYGLYYYPNRLLPMWEGLLSAALTVPPVVFGLIYQYHPRWKSFITAVTIAAAILAFICEPILKYMGIYVLCLWNYLYSFGCYIVFAVFTKWLVDLLNRSTELSRR